MPRTPYLIVHHGTSHTPMVAKGLLSQAHRAGFPVGATVFLPMFAPDTARRYLSDFAEVAAPTIGDPVTHVLHREENRRGGERDKWRYMGIPDPASKPGPFVSQVLLAQTQTGADTVVTPSLVHGLDGSLRNLEATALFAQHGQDSPLVGDRRLLLGTTVTAAILADDKARSDYLNALVEFPSGDLYMRVLLSGSPGYEQVRDRRLIAGLRRAVEALRANDRAVVLPHIGLLGWAMTAFGAEAFGAGISASMQRCCEPSPSRRGQARRLPWYFVPQLLTFVLRDDLAQLQGLSGYEPCDCAFCRTLLLPRRPWDPNEAGQHFLFSCCRLAGELPADEASRPEDLRRRLVAAAELLEVIRSAGRPLDARSEPKHLADWTAALT